VLALVLVVCGPFSMMYVPATLVVPGDAAATADRVVAGESLFRLGILSDTAIFLTEIVLIGLLYALFKPVSATVVSGRSWSAKGTSLPRLQQQAPPS
jgi:hypothetical protein